MTNFQILKKIFSSYFKTAGIMSFIFTVLFGLFVSVVIIIEPLIFTELIKKVEEFYKTGVFNFEEFFFYVGIWGGFILFSIIIQYIYRYVLVSQNCLKNHRDMSSEYANQIISMTYGNYLQLKTGSIYKIYDRGTEYQVMFLFFFFIDFLKSFSGIIFIIIILFYINIQMALVTLASFPIMCLFALFFYKKLFPRQQKNNDKWDEIFGRLGNVMSNFYLVKTFNLDKKFKKSIASDLDECYQTQLSIDKGWSVSDIYTAMFVMISRILVLGFGVYFLINGEITFATLFLFFSYIGWIYFPLGMLFNKFRNLTQWLSAVGKFYETFDNLELDKSGKKGAKISDIEGKIEFKKVGFGYTQDKNIFQDLSFQIKPGKKIALVGTTGSGKSTIVNLLLRLWEPQSGKIKIDGINIKDISKKSLRDHIGVVAQDNSLFNMSIKENLLIAFPKASDAKLKDALQKAEADFVFDLPNGIDTVIGERGLKLSGGEKQRISIARLFLKNPEILILDEATSALDNKTEQSISKALGKLMKSRTSIIIAHRLTTIMDADEIFYLEKGNIIETGSYKELINKKGKFSELASSDHLMIN